ncbi:hypothetical protein [Capnocytophaga canis]|uniref:hypothetical protein n=1 Tax=Capnocytophaga canis TaxID=1848903 RepID=UPI0015621A80|nr:hypothetical protein [Capnocytophaga canis]
METTYFMRGRNSPTEHIFKYDLNGDLISFENTGEPLNGAQKQWLFVSGNFPYDEEKMINMQNNITLKKYFDIEKVPAKITFDDFWNAYGKIGTKSQAKKKFDKLKDSEVIKAFLGIKKEQQKKKLDGTAMPYAETYLNQKRWE